MTRRSNIYSVMEWAGVEASTDRRHAAACLMRGEDIVADFFDAAEARKACEALNKVKPLRCFVCGGTRESMRYTEQWGILCPDDFHRKPAPAPGPGTTTPQGGGGRG